MSIRKMNIHLPTLYEKSFPLFVKHSHTMSLTHRYRNCDMQKDAWQSKQQIADTIE